MTAATCSTAEPRPALGVLAGLPKMFAPPLSADALERVRLRAEYAQLRERCRRHGGARQTLAAKYARRARPTFHPLRPATTPAALGRRGPRHVAGRSMRTRRTSSRSSSATPSGLVDSDEPAPAQEGCAIDGRA